MADYIEREDALTAVDETYLDYLADVKAAVLKIPTADVAPVVHGHWIEENGCQICSECGEEHEWDEYRATYCDVCGAKMDGGDNDGA